MSTRLYIKPPHERGQGLGKRSSAEFHRGLYEARRDQRKQRFQ
jgi:hypothetical protein